MKRITLFICLILLTATAHAGPRELTFGMATNDASVISLSVLKIAYAKLGIEVAGLPMPAQRSLTEADRGVTDGEVARIAAIEYSHPDLIRIPVPLDEFKVSAITLRNDIAINSLADIQNLRIGIRKGIQFAELATKHMTRVTPLSEWDHLFDLLARGRLDVILTTPQTWEIQRQRPGLKESLQHFLPELDTQLYHYLHRKHTDLEPHVSLALQEMTLSGEMQTIREQARQKLIHRHSQ